MLGRWHQFNLPGALLLTAMVLFTPAARLAADDSDPTRIPLPMKVRVFLAQVEERGITLSTKGFPAMKAAIKAGDAAKLARFFSPEFQAGILTEQDGTFRRQGIVELLRVKADPTRVLDREAFARHLIDLSEQVTHESLVLDWKLKDLSPTKEGEYNGSYNSTGQFRVAGVNDAGQALEWLFEMKQSFHSIPAPDEIANTAGWFASLTVTELTAVRSEHVLMRDVTVQAGIHPEDLFDNWKKDTKDRVVSSGGVYLADINDDGLTDVLVTDIGGPHLYRALPDGTFKDITLGSGLRPSQLTLHAAFGDFDNDGLVDVVIDNQIYKNLGNGRFRSYASRSSLRITDLTGLSVVDYDRDGKLDLYVSRQFNTGKTGDSWIDGPGGPGNQLWRNLGNWQFEDVSKSANATAGPLSCFTTVWLDANNDGWPDAYSINEFGGGRLLVNQRDGTFVSRPLLEDYNDFGSMGLAAADVNNDGHIDIFTDNMFSKAGRRVMENLPVNAYPEEIIRKIKRFVTGSELYLNEGGLNFKRAGRDMHVYQVGWSYGPTFVDLDNDGFQDLYANSGFMSANADEPDG